MNYKEMQDYLIEKTRNHTTAKLTNYKLVLNMAMDIVDLQRDRPELNVDTSVSTVSGQTEGYYVNSQEVSQIKIMYITSRDKEVTEVPIEVLRQIFTDPAQQTSGAPDLWAMEKFSPVKIQPTSASVITVVSDSASDTSAFSVRVVGLVGGFRAAENISLNGTTPSAGAKSFTNIYSIEKSAKTTGIITVTSNAGAVTNCDIGPDFLAPKYIFFSVGPGAPDGVYTLSIIARRSIAPMVDDLDVPGDFDDRDFQNAILGVAESLILNDPALAAIAMNADKDNKRVKGIVYMRMVDFRSYRNNLELGRYRGS